jgi:hypothetical protein
LPHVEVIDECAVWLHVTRYVFIYVNDSRTGNIMTHGTVMILMLSKQKIH